MTQLQWTYFSSFDNFFLDEGLSLRLAVKNCDTSWKSRDTRFRLTLSRSLRVYMSTWANFRAWHVGTNQNNNVVYSVWNSKIVLHRLQWGEIINTINQNMHMSKEALNFVVDTVISHSMNISECLSHTYIYSWSLTNVYLCNTVLTTCLSTHCDHICLNSAMVPDCLDEQLQAD